MTILFSEEERLWIEQVPFHWTVKPDCPEELAKAIQRKLSLLYGNEDASRAEDFDFAEDVPENGNE